MTVAIVDSCKSIQLKIAGYIRRFLMKQGHSASKIYFYFSWEDLIANLSLHIYDIVLLGMGIREKVNEGPNLESVLIFITSRSDYAVDSYLASASCYLVKPSTYENFDSVMCVASYHLKRKKEFFSFTHQNGKMTSWVLVDDIVYCDIQGHYVQFHRFGNSMLRVRITFAEAAALLSPYSQFLECYRGCIINLDHVYKADEFNFLMDTGEQVPLRRKNHRRLLQKYSSYLFDKDTSEME